MKRINGFLDLDHYFEIIMEQENIGRKGLIANGYIKESDYNTYHAWLKINNEYYYFKPHNNPYIELVVSECANFLEIDSVSYDLVIFQNRKGVISKSYRKNNCSYVSGIDILSDYLMEQSNIESLMNMGYDKTKLSNEYEVIVESKALNNLEIIWQALEDRYKNKNVNVENLVNKIVELFVFNILVGQHDGEPQNWEIEESDSGVKLMPFIDGELCFQNIKYLLNPRSSLATNFNDSYNNNYEHLREFFRISSSEYTELFLSKFEIFTLGNFELILKKIEERTNTSLPLMFKARVLESFKHNRECIEQVINEMNIRRKGVI